ncbi:L-ribulose 5-phosphate 4-epimerase [Thermoanaerobacter uzonensis DSM 18761]|jgi:L-ribulose-5-phosphate 4-epimerase|uniref:L-ribulose-5-phosphate 4-epimerase n=1 Tax=Thermoanaerobacter uzonensis DSM 18761 TaxID=1123369 RepID=A0A1M4SNG1_9THEO|nr:L-ribulose-5-phosphate 4-epimerase [Thermoanaerobacter uzonensis]SHE33487.1 L-ribulose 5-phosphate 4-epimerase [Thermoanaerobacter uzonensis DSM 18761]
MLEELKERVCKANIELFNKGLVIYTWGNVSAIDRQKLLIVIKPSGIPYTELTPDQMVVVDLNGRIVEGSLNPSSDTATHLELYNNFDEVGSIIHTHSTWATIWAQVGKDIPPLGTTHADHFYGSIPCTRDLTENEVLNDYERNTAKVILECFKDKEYTNIPGVLVNKHGVFVWGKNPEEAIYNAVVMEEIAKMAYYTLLMNGNNKKIEKYILDKHYLRKHGQNAYYGQNIHK